jgi:hydroxymethylpyrimidine pyrophosphatase-like HAD family hydrolase
MLSGRELARFPSGTLRAADVRSVRRIDPFADSEAAKGRRHVFARYEALVIGEDGETTVERIAVKGLGPGYFSERARYVAAALPGYITEPIGIEGGLLYLREPAPEARTQAPISSLVEQEIAAYVVRRRSALAIDQDPSPRLLDDDMVWRVAADALGKALLGPVRALAYPITHAISRRLLAVSRPSVIDGNLGLSYWSTAPTACRRSFLKSSWLGRLTCFDAAFDLAAAAAALDVEELRDGDSAPEPSGGDRLLQAFHEQTQEQIDAERWFVYQLVELSTQLDYLGRAIAAADDAGEDDRSSMDRWLATRRALARAHQRYLHGVFFSDLSPASTGPLCAFDVDWVLETSWLQFPALAPAGARALRALLRHGFRPVLATARSLDEVRDRCRAYDLAGGVAEFGSVVYDHTARVTLPQVKPEDQAELVRLREVLSGMRGVYLDPAYRSSIRAVRFHAGAGCRGLEEETIQTALATAGADDVIQVFRGGGQTDFVHASVDKGTGLRALAATLGVEKSATPLAFAVGDDWPDLPMLDLGRAAFAPANLSARLRDELQGRNVSITPYPFGSGALQAVTSFLGHDPRRCEICRPRNLSDDEALLVGALAGLDGPRRGRIRQTLALTGKLARAGGARYRNADA